MTYFKVFWNNLKLLYQQVWGMMFSKEANFQGDLNEFHSREGLFWRLMTLQKQLLQSILAFLIAFASLVGGYIIFAVMLVVFLLLPAIAFAVFPIFTFKRYRRLKRIGKSL